MAITEGLPISGAFQIGDLSIAGELTLNGAQTKLYLHNPNFFRPNANTDGCILGVLHDKTKVSLIECNASPISGTASMGEERYNFAEVFPHFVVSGSRHLGTAQKLVAAIQFVTDDASSIFYDFDAFSFVLRPDEVIQHLTHTNSKAIGRDIPFGNSPYVAYFTGKTEIFSAATALGTVSASHNPQTNWGGPDGVYIRNFISLDITFPDLSTFDDAISAVLTMLLFLELIAGRKQNLKSVSLRLDDSHETPSRLNVYWSLPPKRGAYEGERPHPADLPMTAADKPAEFASVLTEWLSRHPSWQASRERFSNGFALGNSYSVDRLIGAANMFDILPASAVPADAQLSSELETAASQARELFKKLPVSAQRDSVLGALGRMKKSALKQKINHRAELLLTNSLSQYSRMNEVIDLAIDCRNYFVHGGESKIDYTKHFFATVPFLTNTLEFVFATSDLIEAGWDVAEWRTRLTSMSHPFGAYRVNYDNCLEKLVSLLP